MSIFPAGRSIFVAQWVLAVVLPAWLFVGRVVLGVELGWIAILGMLVGVFVIGALLVPPLLTVFDRTVRARAATRTAYSVAIIVMWAAMLVASTTVSDASDGPDPLPSAVTLWTDGALGVEASTAVATAALFVILVTYVTTIVLAVAGIVRSRREAARPGGSAPPPPS